jgi:hypothetical protein
MATVTTHLLTVFNRSAVYESSLFITLLVTELDEIYLYRVSQEEMSVFWGIIVLVILRKKVRMNMCPIPNGFRERAI